MSSYGIDLCRMRVREIEELLAMTSVPSLGDQIAALAKTIAFHAPNTDIRDLARKLRKDAVDPDTAHLRIRVRDLAAQLEERAMPRLKTLSRITKRESKNSRRRLTR